MKGPDSRTRFSSFIRQNAIALLALFFALSGSAMALDGQNTVFSDDIVNQEVKTVDLAPEAVSTAKLAPASVNSAKVVDDSLRSEDILDGQIRAIDVAFGTLRGDEILDDSLSGNDIVDGGVSGDDVNEATLFNDNSLTTADLADNSVGKAELGSGAVGASEIADGIVDRPDATPTLIPGGAAENGSYNTDSSTATCNAGEEVIGGYGYWTGGGGLDAELFIQGVRIDHALERVTVGGGNDDGEDSSLVAVATCLQQ